MVGGALVVVVLGSDSGDEYSGRYLTVPHYV